MTQSGRAIFERYFHRLYVDRDLDVIEEMRASTAGARGLSNDTRGHRDLVSRIHETFADAAMVIERCVESGNDVALLLRFQGTTRSGRRLTVMGSGFARIIDGRIDDVVNLWDVAGLVGDLADDKHTAEIRTLSQAVDHIATLERRDGSRRVIFVHGAPGDASAWAGVAALMPGAVCVDLPDHGAADEPDATVEDHIDAVARAVRDAGGPVVLVGHSYGAWVAAHAASRSPSHIARLVLVAGLAEISGDTAAALAGFAQALDAGVLDVESGTAVAAARWLGPEPHDAAHVDAIRQLFVRTGATRLARQIRRTTLASLRVRPSGAPTDVIAIEHDGAVPRAATDDLASTLGVPVTVWPGTNHFPHWVDPAAFVSRLGL